MEIPKRVAIGRHDIREFHMKFPESGKQIVIMQEKPYQTSDPAELDFASRQKGLVILELGEAELRGWLTAQRDPTVYNTALTDEQAREFMWEDRDEKELIKILRDHGYVVYKRAEPKKRKPRTKKEASDE